MQIRLCDSKTAYQVLPDKPAKLHLVKLRNILDSLGAVSAVTPYMAVIRSDGIEFSIYSSGKILFRNSLDLGRSKAVAARAYRLLGLGE